MTKKALSLAEFRELTEATQYELLHRDGVYVGKRELDGRPAILFQLYGFYVEVNYQHYRREIAFLIISGEVDILQPYLDQIVVRGLDQLNPPSQD